MKIQTRDASGFRVEECVGIFWPPEAYEAEFGVPPHADMLREFEFSSGKQFGALLPDTGGAIAPWLQEVDKL